MAKKTYTKNNKSCRVTFELPPDVNAQEVFICGEFNNWAPDPMPRRKQGNFSVTLTLPTERSYRYRFLLDGERWENDWEADTYVPNEFGTEDSLITV